MSDEWVMVPHEPVDAQFGELARDIVMWWTFSPPTGEALHKHLKRLGRDIPAWLPDLIANRMYVPPKGAVAAAIYRAMLDAAPAAPQQAAHNAREINNLVGKTDSQQAGPVWMRPDQLQKARHAPFLCRVSPTKDAPDLMPMFLHPPAAEVQRVREALEYLIEKCGDSDDAQYSTLGTKFVRDIARRALEGS